ncbi:MAG: hypothetical protein II227_03490, partial [Clostridia bacterium]|nr:hypothetical protein [Clostridia bacterium]
HHHHHHDHECSCGHHHDHHADEVFTSWGVETAKKFDRKQIELALQHLDTGVYGMVLRAKGILMGNDGQWIHFDYVPEEHNVRNGSADITGCIGTYIIIMIGKGTSRSPEETKCLKRLRIFW